ncbi:MAG: hypothetical protein R3C28_24540, partial [Pirellulaceae bacterium]
MGAGRVQEDAFVDNVAIGGGRSADDITITIDENAVAADYFASTGIATVAVELSNPVARDRNPRRILINLNSISADIPDHQPANHTV